MSSGSRAAQILGARIRNERARLEISQLDFASLAGMNVTNLGRIERGEGNPNFDTLLRLAGVLEVDISDLVAGISAKDIPGGRRRYTARDFIREREAHQVD